MYLIDCQDAESCVDCIAGINISDCYRVSHSSRLHNCQFISESYDCIDSTFLFDCRNCDHCFGASNKRNKKYLWWNEQLTKEEWEVRRAEIDLASYAVSQEMLKKFYAMIADTVWPENFNVQTTGSTGEYLIQCSDNSHSSFGRDGHHNYYCYGLWDGATGNAFCCAVPGNDSYFAGPLTNSANIKFSAMMVRCDNCEYSFGCYECTNCFGCVGLRHKKFHILNKEYSEEEYWKKLDELKCAMLDRKEYGQTLPSAFSTSYIPEGGPMIYLGAEVEDCQKIGMPTYPIDSDGAFGTMRLEGKEVASANDLPDHLDQIDDSWAGKIMMDTENNRPFTYLKPEIVFYKKHKLAVPRQHFTARVRNLIWTTNTGIFEERKCAKCEKTLTVATNRIWPDRKIYCEACYLNHLEKNG